MEKFVWFSDVIEKAQGLVIATGPGFCTIAPDAGSYASVQELRSTEKPGMLGSATALLALEAGGPPQFVLIERDAGAVIDPLKWQFPAGRIGLAELPLTTACRELSEEVRILGLEGPVSFKDTQINLGRQVVEFLTEDTIHEFKARYVICQNTVEFYFPMRLVLPSLMDVFAEDNEHYNRRVCTFRGEEVNALAENGLLTESAAAIWKHWRQPK